MRYFYFLLLFLFSYSLIAQGEAFRASLGKSSSEYLNSYIQKDWKKYTEYTYPNIIEMAGGEDVIVRLAEETIAMYKSLGFDFVEAKINDDIESINSTANIQAIVTASMVMSTGTDNTETPLKLFAISTDSGSTWKFVDLSQYDVEGINLFVPEFDDDLKAFW